MKKTIPWLLSGTLVLTALAGCTAQNSSPAGTSTTASPTGQAGAPKPLTFTFLDYSHPSWPMNKEWPVWKYIKEKTGVTLDIQVPPGSAEDQLDNTLNLTVASGNMPNMMYTHNKKTADKFGQQGALVNVLDYVNEMPNFKKWMEKYPTETQNALASDGKMYMLPNQGIGETNRMNWMYREDIFKKNEIASPSTWDELYSALKKLKQVYPDSYPMSFRNGLSYLRNLAPGFGTSGDNSADNVYYDFDKKEWRYGPTEDSFKTMIAFLNKFYKEGLIPPDFLTVDTKQWQDLMSTNRSFVTVDYISRVDFFNLPMRKQEPGFNLLYMPAPAGWAGGPQKNAYTQFVEAGFMVTSTSKQIKDIMHYLDFFYSEVGKDFASWGIEGVTYKNDNGKKQLIGGYADVSDFRKKTGFSTDGTYIWLDYDVHLSLSSPELQDAYKIAPKYDSLQQPRPAFTQQELEVISTTGQTLQKTRDQNLAKFITGERDLAEWSKYVDEMKKIGVDKIVGIYKAGYDRTLQTKK
jgi:putative aldouronate transport system substrate-binding protein